MPQYLMPQRRQGSDDALSVIAQGLQIANSVYGLKTAMDQSDYREQDQAWKGEDRKVAAEQRAYERRLSEQDRSNLDEDRAFKKSEQQYGVTKRSQKDQGILDKSTQLGLQKDYQMSDQPSAGALQFQDENGSPLYIKARAKYKWEANGLNGELGDGGGAGGMRTPTSKQQMQMDKDQREREVPGVGLALTIEDAKALKSATEMKEKFDRQLDEMISLRDKHGGGTVVDREDVARGRQLSKDLLLTYKDLSKLGVLSKSDEDILNAIIPPDPLGYSFTPNQDPIMNNLKKFRQDSNSDYQSRLKSRLERAYGQPSQDSFPESSGITQDDAMKELKRRGLIK